MSKALTDKPLLRVLRGEILEPSPIWLMRQAGRYLPEYREIRKQVPDFLTLCLSPQLAAEITLQPLRRFNFDAAILFADILLVPHAIGQKVWFEEGEGPRLGPLDLAAIRPKPGIVRTVLSPVFETIQRVRGSLPASTTLIGFAGAPWTVATYMIAGRGSDDSADARLFALRNPGAFSDLLEILIEATSDYLLAQIEAGAESLQLFESWAGTIPSDSIDAFSLTPIKRIIARIRQHAPATPILVFPRGAGLNYARYASETGTDAISLDAHTPLDLVSRELPKRLVLQGNLDPLTLVAGGRALKQATTAVVEAARGRPHIFNLGHGVRPDTPVEHVAELVRLVRGTVA